MPLEPWEHAEAARHEFGHALASIVLGIGAFHRVVILREPDSLGRFGYIENSPGQAERRLREPEPEPAPASLEVVSYAKDPAWKPAVENMLRRCALFTYAGIAAQDPRSVGDWWCSRLFETSTQDRKTLAREFARWGRELGERQMHGQSLRGARRLVDGHWGALEAGGYALLARLGASNAEGALSYEEAHALVKGAPRARNPWRECQKWDRRARAAAWAELVRERNGEYVVDLPARSTGRALRPAPLAPLSPEPAGGLTRGGVGPVRASRRSPAAAPPAGLPLLVGWADDGEKTPRGLHERSTFDHSPAAVSRR